MKCSPMSQNGMDRPCSFNTIDQQRKSAALFDDPVRELQNFKTSLTPV
jgi:hypothetical protein